MVDDLTSAGRRRARRAGRAAGRRGTRAARRDERRAAILAAALEEFAARGFAATRLDDVARRAGVAKGTIYLHFRDKESLFQELVRAMLSPLVGTIEAAALRDLPIRAVVEMIVDLFVNEIYGTRRKDVIRLIIAEGSRFPKLAEVYYREVIARVLPVMRARLTLDDRRTGSRCSSAHTYRSCTGRRGARGPGGCDRRDRGTDGSRCTVLRG